MSTKKLVLTAGVAIFLIAAFSFGLGYLVGSGSSEPIPIVIEQHL